MASHIPDGARPGRTYCGRVWRTVGAYCADLVLLAVINLKVDDIESATCKACQRSDVRRQLQEIRRAARHNATIPTRYL